MKNGPMLTSALILCYCLASCSKGGGVLSPVSPTTSISLHANDSLIAYPVNLVNTATKQPVLRKGTVLVIR